MIRYPQLKKGATIGVTAPSSGLSEDLHHLLRSADMRLRAKGYEVKFGETPWTQRKAKSASAKKRAKELNEMLVDDSIDLIIPPWGGELLVEILEHLDFDAMPPKWILGYSDVSLLLLAVTLKTGIATAHGTNLVDLRGETTDPTTTMWETVMATELGQSVTQVSSEKFQLKWDFENPTSCVFHLTEPTVWRSIPDHPIFVKGRLLGGCIDIIKSLIGTPFGDLTAFRETINHEPLLWYFENCEMTTSDLKRTLVQMKLAGWFNQCSGLLFGRSSANHPVEDYESEDVYRELYEELNIPIIYDVDCGHVPPQMTFINGAWAEVQVNKGIGKVIQTFC